MHKYVLQPVSLTAFKKKMLVSEMSDELGRRNCTNIINLEKITPARAFIVSILMGTFNLSGSLSNVRTQIS